MRAPFEPGCWIPALVATARATGSASAGLLGGRAHGEVTLAHSSIRSDAACIELAHVWIGFGGNDPRRNPLLYGVLRSPILREVSDADVISRDERRLHPLWNEFYNKAGLPHYCVSPLWRHGATQLVVSLSRTSKEGPISESERKRFRRLAICWRQATVLSHKLKDVGARLLTGGLEQLSIAAVILDSFGRCVATTPKAEEIVRAGALLQVNGGWIAPVTPEESAKFERAVRRSLGDSSRNGSVSEFDLRGSRGRWAHIRVVPLPRENDIGCDAAAMMLIDWAADLQSALPADSKHSGLTAAETEIANAIISGRRPQIIANERHVSIQTVRSQIKSIYAKTGVHSCAELRLAHRTG